ncbi:MAG: ArsR family transcriptional regulator [Euryarchaeota archaeon]|nr:ArsR family transcriptional regulator [Euryarchaeota archaeon]
MESGFDSHRVLHIIPLGEEIKPIMVGVRNFPIAGFALLHATEKRFEAIDVKKQLEVLGVPITLHEYGGNPMMGIMSVINNIVQGREPLAFDELLINVGAADKHVACAAISAAFVNGIRAIHVMDDKLIPLPVLRFSYRELVSEAKLNILQSLSSGSVGSLAELSEKTGIDKSLLSYHLRGGKDGQGLEELGFVNIDRGAQGRLLIELTHMGKMLLIGRE